ncbi:MAG: hypothetical protein IT233_04360 [Bacteroidia bacterium]|nr:hypothetical protein [Bacteroidia bacterium]
MFRFLFLILAPLLCIGAVLLFFQPLLATWIFHETASQGLLSYGRLITDLRDPATDQLFFDRDPDKVYVLGSSELSGTWPGASHNFFNNRYGISVLAVGNEGNQSLSVFTQLLSRYDQLKGKKILILLSPTWFESKPAFGTSAEVFLRYNPGRQLRKILNTPPGRFREYLAYRVAELMDEINAPSQELRLLNLEYLSGRSPAHRFFIYPLIKAENLIHIPPDYAFHELPVQPMPRDNEIPDWDSIVSDAGNRATRLGAGNLYGMDQELFLRHYQNRRGNIQPVPEGDNTELGDLKMLLELIEEGEAHASLVLLPLHSLYFKNPDALTPVLTRIREEILKKNFPLLDLYTEQPEQFDKRMLSDAMHPSEYGWLLVNRFLYETYCQKQQ